VVVFGGFAEVSPQGLTVLADKAVPADELDVATIAAEIKDTEEDLADTTDEHVRDKARRKLEQLRAVQVAATGAAAASH
jgi:F-type H+-transporting ATPase subunit epsilon